MSVDKNAIAQRLLEGLGFKVEHEPRWVGDGEVPDFFCTREGNDLWVEVKAIKEADCFEAQTLRARWLYERATTVAENGLAFAWVDEEATEQHVKAALALTRNAIRRLATAPSTTRYIYIVVPHDADFSSHVKIALETENSTEETLAVRSRSEHYGRPKIARELRGRTGVTIEDTAGNRRIADPFELGLAEDDFAVGVEVKRSEERLRFTGVSLTGPAQRLTTVETVRRAAKKANSQFKNACRARPASCLLMIFQDGILVQNTRSFASAFYGDLVATIPSGGLSFGANGLWSEKANRTTTVAALVRNNGTPVLIPNPWATLPIAQDVFPWPGARIDPNGKVHLPE